MATAPQPTPYEPPTVEEEIRRRQEGVDWDTHSRKVARSIEAHDAAGFETSYMDFAELNDGYGSNVGHGDLSVQRLTEQSRNCVVNGPSYGTPYDLDPFQSRAQARYMHAASERGEISKATVKEYDEKTDFSKLPERK